MSFYIPLLGRSRAAKRRRQIAVTADDVRDITTVAQTAMDADATLGFTPKVTTTYTRGGVIVQVTDTYRIYPEQQLRAALEQMGYVVENVAAATVAVTGRDPHHTWNEVSP